MPYDLAAAIAHHMDFMHGTEEVSVQHRTLAGVTSSTTTGVLALFRALDGSVMSFSAGAQAVGTRARVHLKAADLETDPKKGDRVVSATKGTWELDGTVSLQTLGTRWACEAKYITGP